MSSERIVLSKTLLTKRIPVLWLSLSYEGTEGGCLRFWLRLARCTFRFQFGD